MENDLNQEHDVGVVMSDGTRLSARIWRPVGEGTFPAVLEALPYRKRDGTAWRDEQNHPAFARAGYACVRLDLRGNGESEGLFDDEYSPQELQDIYEAIAWIAEQPWCSGAVGMQGISWGGFNGLMVAAMRPPALKAIITICSSVDRFHDDIHYKGGCLLTENIGWAATAAGWFSTPPDPAIAGDSWREKWLERLEATPFLAERWHQLNCRTDYWKHGSVCEDYSAIQAAVLSIGGWHDGYRNTIAHLVENLDAPVQGIVGPWNHKYPHIATPGPRADYIGMALRWWDKWLKGIDNGAEVDPAYRAFLMDSVKPETSFETRPGRWIAEAALPSPNIQNRTLPLSATGLDDGGANGPRSIETNTECGAGFGEFFPFGFGPGELPDDQTADDALSLCYDGQPMTETTDIVGAPSLSLRLSANQRRAQVAVRLCDLRPDGTSALITHGFLNLRHRNGHECFEDLIPGEVVQATVTLDQCAYRLPAGHRLRVAISPSYWPFIWPEPEPVTLTITEGALSLPVRRTATGDECSFDPPREAPPASHEVRAGAENKTWNTDPQTGERSLIISADHTETEDLAHGLIHGDALREEWAIIRGNPASARAHIRWDKHMSRGDWATSTTAVLSMTGDVGNFHISMQITAREGEVEVFSKEWKATVPRD
ncbi:MAG: CocE/NonD family hydrolase [Pikeienuella sp.]